MGRPLISSMLSVLPLKLDIVGTKRNFVLKMGDWFSRDGRSGLRDLDLGGRRLGLDLGHSNERLLYYALSSVLRCYESSGLFAAMTRYLRPGATFVDIGANLGIFSILAKTRFESKVVCFEPEKRHFDFLNRNKSIFDEVYPVALSDAEGEQSFFVASEENLGGSSLVMSNQGWEHSGYAAETRVQVRRFDQMFSGEREVSLVKIDVEGNELQTVAGMSGYFESGRKPPLWVEVRGPTSDRNPNSAAAVTEFLTGYGYRPFVGAKAEPFSAERHTQPVFDLLFVTEPTAKP